MGWHLEGDDDCGGSEMTMEGEVEGRRSEKLVLGWGEDVIEKGTRSS